MRSVAIPILSVLALVACGVGGPGDDDPFQHAKPYIKALRAPVHVSHRGGAALYPESTIYAFTRAVEDHQTDVLEIDLVMTADGHIVVIHDVEVDRTTDGTGLVSEMTLAEVQALDAAYQFDPAGDGSYPLRGQGITIPTLDETFTAFPTLFYNLEIKDETIPFEVDLANLVELHALTNRVCWGAAEDTSAERLRVANPDVCLYYPRNAASCFVLEVLNDRDPITSCDGPYDALNMLFTALTPPVTAAAHAAGIAVYAWTVDDPDVMRALFDEGVDGIMTDRPDLLREVIDSM